MKQRARAFMRITSTLKLLAAVQHISSHPIVSINEKNVSSHRQAHSCGMYAAALMIFSAVVACNLRSRGPLRHATTQTVYQKMMNINDYQKSVISFQELKRLEELSVP